MHKVHGEHAMYVKIVAKTVDESILESLYSVKTWGEDRSTLAYVGTDDVSLRRSSTFLERTPNPKV